MHKFWVAILEVGAVVGDCANRKFHDSLQYALCTHCNAKFHPVASICKAKCLNWN